MLVYRVEDKITGRGMYRCGLRCAGNMQHDMRHPDANQDAELRAYWQSTDYVEREEIYFAFATVAQLKAWIYKDSWRKEIAKEGLVVSVYSARFIRIGATQAVFRLRTAKKIGEVDILNLDAPMIKV